MPAWGVSTEMLDLDPSFGEKTRELLTKKPNDLTGLVKAVGELTVYFFG